MVNHQAIFTDSHTFDDLIDEKRVSRVAPPLPQRRDTSSTMGQLLRSVGQFLINMADHMENDE